MLFAVHFPFILVVGPFCVCCVFCFSSESPAPISLPQRGCAGMNDGPLGYVCRSMVLQGYGVQIKRCLPQQNLPTDLGREGWLVGSGGSNDPTVVYQPKT